MILALVSRQGTARAATEAKVLQQVRALTAKMRGRWYDKAAIADYRTNVVQVVAQGQQITGNLADSYLRAVFDEIGVPYQQTLVRLDPQLLRRVEPAVEWDRPGREFRRLRIAGLSELDAEIRAEARAVNLASMDLALADRAAFHDRMTSAHGGRVVGFRRVLHPELARFGVCGLCVVAADRVYRAEQLLPLHNGCNCTVAPVTDTKDPAGKLNAADLSALYEAAGSNTRADLQRIRVKTVQHGELGPILGRADYTYRTTAEPAT